MYDCRRQWHWTGAPDGGLGGSIERVRSGAFGDLDRDHIAAAIYLEADTHLLLADETAHAGGKPGMT